MKKISLTLVFLMMSAVSFTIAASDYVRGDCNQDGTVNITDVTCLLDYLLSGNETGINLDAADTNQDGIINISDISSQLDYLLLGSWPDEPVTPPDSHDYVDLGLPSGTLWATCNVGANSPEEYGDYFAWGETEPEPTDYYDWSTYKWYNSNGVTKYCTQSGYGVVDNKTELDPEDDAAYVNWGPSWRMPTTQQQNELILRCSWQRTTMNGVNGDLGTGPNGNTLFLPAAGTRKYNRLDDAGSNGIYWSRTLDNTNSFYAWYMYFRTNGSRDTWTVERDLGCPVRPVRVTQN